VETRRRKSYADITDVLDLPTLTEVQTTSFRRFQEELLLDLFSEISPIESFSGDLRLHLPSRNPESSQFVLGYRFDEPEYSVAECMERDLSYAAPLYVKVALENCESGEVIVNEIYMGDIPLMTDNATFVINGTQRVVVSQLIRSPGVYFDTDEDRTTGRRMCNAKLIPDRGAWMELETRKSDYITVRMSRKRKLPVTLLLRALAAVDDGTDNGVLHEGTDEELLEIFKDVDTQPDHLYIPASLRQEPTWNETDGRSVAEQALLEFYNRMRPGDPPKLETAREYLKSELFDSRRYDLARVGRYKLNQRLGAAEPLTRRTISKGDLIKIVKRMISINNNLADPTDTDHLGNRRVKTVGELLQNQVRVGLRRMERVVRDRMSTRRSDAVAPSSLINIRPVVSSVRTFFGSSQLSQFMDQTNPLAELTHKRTLSALGPGGLKRNRAGFDVRDVHHSHYGRICPIETPEGPNIGLIVRLATYGVINEFGFIETPYRQVIDRVPHDEPETLLGKTLRETVVNPETAEVVAQAGTEVSGELAHRIASLPLQEEVKVRPIITQEIIYLSADEEDKYTIAQANAELDERGQFVASRVSARRGQRFLFVRPERVDFLDVAPKQVVGISAALIPFLEHNDANRALMGSNMQRQAVPLLKPEAPVVSTGMEWQAAMDSGQTVIAMADGRVVSVTGRAIVVDESGQQRVYHLKKYQRSNQSTCVHQRAVVSKGQWVKSGDVLADSASTDRGELALGQNALVAFMSWGGGNYEDAILISDRLVREDVFTSIHIEEYETESRDTRRGPEEITRDIPNVGEDALRNLDEEGIIRIGAEVGPNDILVGRITPKGETEPTAEEKLLRAIFGDKARAVRDTSLRLPHGGRGTVVDVTVFTRENHRDMKPGVDKMVRVKVAQQRKITEGDKMAGRHGNKGVISRVVPMEDMPFLEDGTPVEIILNPLGVPGRMNIGQILEAHLGWAANVLGFQAITPVFDGADEVEIEAELARAWMMQRAWETVTERAWQWIDGSGSDSDYLQDDDEVRMRYLVAWLSRAGYEPELVRLNRDYARRGALREWLREQGYDPDELLTFGDETRSPSKRRESDLRARQGCWRLWMEQHGVDNVDAIPNEDLRGRAEALARKINRPTPTAGKMVLFDGRTGERFDQPVTVGVIHLMKLTHLVEDKVHARSTGPYSLVTQQPLGGKAQFGGQRFGEMEVWALEAYGAAHTLQEMLTVKSDDVHGRVKAYQAIVQGEPIEEPGIPASFRVLVKELQSLGLAVEAVTDTGDVMRFGKDAERIRKPKLGLGLLSFGGTR
jgi:DNA-directed RNA polymerase subunit beta